MATRFNFTTTTASISPAFGSPLVGGTWTNTAAAVRNKMTTTATKGTTAITTSATVTTAQNGNGLVIQGISEPLAAQTISSGTTFSGQIMGREFAINDNVDAVAILMMVVAGDGSSETGCLVDLSFYDTANELTTSSTCRNRTIAAAVTVTRAVTVNAGDRLVIELGGTVSTGSGTSPEIALKYGENATDLPVNNTQTTDGAGWVELSQTLTFQSAGSITGSATMEVDGTGSITQRVAVSGTDGVVFTGTGSITQRVAVSGSATVEVDGTGGITQRVAVTGSATVEVDGTGTVTQYNVISGSATMEVDGTGSVTAYGVLTGGGLVALTGTGSITSYGILDGSGTIAITGLADILTGYSPVAGTGTIVIDGTGAITGYGYISGSGTIVLSGSGVVVALVDIDGTAGIVFTGTGVIVDGHPRYLIMHEGPVRASLAYATECVVLEHFTSPLPTLIVTGSEVVASIFHESVAEIE